MMQLLRELKHRLARIFTRRQLEKDLQDELAFHIAMREEQLRGAGDVSPERTAARRFGNTTRLREECREVWTFHFIDRWWTDLRYAVKGLNKSKAWTAIAVLSLGVGIGINTGVWRISLSAHPELPVRNPAELVAFHFGSQKAPPSEGFRMLTSIAEFGALRSANQTLSDLFAFSERFQNGNLIVSGQGDAVEFQYVTGNYFTALGIAPALGRVIVPDDDRPSAAPVALISYSYWSRRFHRDPDVLGASVLLNRQPLTIIGVLPDGLIDASGLLSIPDVQLPLALVPARRDSIVPAIFDDTPALYHQPTFWQKMPEFSFLFVMGRPKPGVSIAQIQSNFSELAKQSQKAEWDAFMSRLTPEERADPYLNLNRDWARAYIVPGNRGVADPDPEIRRYLTFMTTVAGIALLMVCMNLANHLLARVASRQREIAVRWALGASRARLLRQLLTETAALSVLAAIVSIPVSYWPSLALSAWLPPGVPVPPIHPMDWRLLAFNLSLGLIAGLIAGTGPALRTIAMNARRGVHEDMSPFAGSRLLPRVLLITQVAVSIVLLIVAGLFVKAVRNIREAKLGFNHANVAVFTIDPAANGYNSSRSTEIYGQIVQKLLQTPGVESATLSDLRVDEFSRGTRGKTRVINGRADTIVERRIVDVGFFSTMEIPLRLGRAFNSDDNPTGPVVAVVNEAFVRAFFKTPNPVGDHVRFGADERRAHDVQIVGVVGNVNTGLPEDADKPMLFTPHLQWPSGPRTFEVRTRVEPNDLLPAIRSVVRSVDATLPVFGMFSHAFLTESRIAGNQLVLGPMLRLVGALVLGFAMIGVFSLMSYTITQRTREIGIRMAIGAERRRVLLSVMWETQGLVLYGVFIGIPVALGLAAVMQLRFFGLNASDPATIAGIILFTFAVASIAGYVPARRASRVDPMVALRHE